MLQTEKRFLFITASLLVLDRIGKWFAVAYWSTGAFEPFPGVRFGFLMNRGFVLSIPSDAPALLVLLVIAFVAFALWFVKSVRSKKFHDALGIAMILLAALSNVFDRVYYGGVVDFMQLGFPMLFNLADVVIVVSVVWLLDRKKGQG